MKIQTTTPLPDSPFLPFVPVVCIVGGQDFAGKFFRHCADDVGQLQFTRRRYVCAYRRSTWFSSQVFAFLASMHYPACRFGRLENFRESVRLRKGALCTELAEFRCEVEPSSLSFALAHGSLVVRREILLKAT